MNYAILYSSQTGNTAGLAEAVRSVLPPESCIHFGGPDPSAMEADLVFVGYWIHMGTCDAASAGVLGALTDCRVALFGTAGSAGNETYCKAVLDKVHSNLQESNKILGDYLCQGAVSPEVRAQYAAYLAENPEERPVWEVLKGFDTAVSHPSQADLEGARNWARDIWAGVNR